MANCTPVMNKGQASGTPPTLTPVTTITKRGQIHHFWGRLGKRLVALVVEGMASLPWECGE